MNNWFIKLAMDLDIFVSALKIGHFIKKADIPFIVSQPKSKDVHQLMSVTNSLKCLELIRISIRPFLR